MRKLPHLSSWAVEIEGFPSKTIDPEDLTSLFEGYAL